MSQRTPGPWVKAERPWMVIAGDRLVADCFGDRGTSLNEAIANATLCAGSLDLLTAAKNLRAAQREYMADRGNDAKGAAVSAAAIELDVAIAVAETHPFVVPDMRGRLT